MKKDIRYDKNALEELYTFDILVQKDFLGLVDDLKRDGRLSYPDAKKVTDDVFEMRISQGGSFRGLYAYAYKNWIIILHFFQKKTRKTPIKNLKLAEKRLKKYV